MKNTHMYVNHNLCTCMYIAEDADGGSVKVVLLGYLVVEVWDHDMGNPDDFLGCVLIPLSSLTLTPQQQWYTLERQGQRDLVSGKIELKINLEEVEQGGPVSPPLPPSLSLSLSLPLSLSLVHLCCMCHYVCVICTFVLMVVPATCGQLT